MYFLRKTFSDILVGGLKVALPGQNGGYAIDYRSLTRACRVTLDDTTT